MKKKQYTALEVLFPQGRAEVLRLLFKSPQKERYVRELAGMSGLNLCTIQDELRKLRALRVVTSRSNRYHRFYRANQQHPLFASILQIVENSDKLPPLGRLATHRQRHKKARRRKQRRMPADRPIHWDLFSKTRKT